MHNDARAVCMGLMLACGAVQAAEPSTASPPPRPPDRAEYRPHDLPDDVFKPSEEVSDDYPIAFPTDI
jgi:hypothetical protein